MSHNDGLMGAIMALTAPPSDGNNKGNKQDKNNQKKNNRSQQKELICDSCGEGGQPILSCTECPSICHPICDDPPIDDESVTPGYKWQCRSCRFRESKADSLKVEVDDLEDLSSQEEQMQALNEIFSPRITRSKSYSMDSEDSSSCTSSLNASFSSILGSPFQKRKRGTNSPFQPKKKIRKTKVERNAETVEWALSRAATIARSVNPKAYEIPPTFPISPYVFPGSSRSSAKKIGNTSVRLKPTIVDLENYCVPKPTVFCYNCSKTCRNAPLIKCDYCSHHFHFDCVNPPLTTVPVGFWMCPLHCEPILESKLLKSSKLSERIKIWDMTHKPVDRTAVIVNFLKQVNRQNPPFGKKVKFPEESRFYFHRKADRPGRGPVYYSNDRFISFMDKEALERNKDDEHKQKLYECYNEPLNSIEEEWEFLDLSTLVRYEEPRNNMTIADHLRIASKFQRKRKPIKAKIETEEESDVEEEEPDEILQDGDEVVSRNKGVKKTKIIRNEEAFSAESDENLPGFDMLLKAAEKHPDFERRMSFLRTMPVEEVFALAARKLADYDSAFEAISNNTANGQSAIIDIGSRPVHSQIQCSSQPTLYIFVYNYGKIIRLLENSLTIGTDIENMPQTSLNPKIFTPDCLCVSSFHAVLFFDQIHKRWEIINYSEHGMLVDGVFFDLNIEGIEDNAAEVEEETTDEMVVMKTKIFSRQSKKVKTCPPKGPTKSPFSCPCNEEIKSHTEGVDKSEGSAVLYKGSCVQLGCFKMVIGYTGLNGDVPHINKNE